MNEAQINKQFFHALAVGFKKDTIRLMLAPLFKRCNLDDDDLMKEVNDAVDADAENKKKTKSKSAASSITLNVDSVDVKEPVSPAVSADSNALVLKELAKLSGAVMDLSGLKSTVEKLEVRVNNIVSNPASTPFLPGATHHNHPLVNRFNRCKTCEDAGLGRCMHCTLCCELGHKRANCPKNV